MTNTHRNGRVLAVLALLAAVGLVAPGDAQAIDCQYHLNIENQADESIHVQAIEWKKKDGANWKPWRNVEDGPLTLADGAKEEYKKVQDTALCYRFKWKLQWKCAAQSSWHDYQIPPDDPDNDRVSNWFLLVKGCSEGDVSRSEDGDLF
jgi:hypothetical protein